MQTEQQLPQNEPSLDSQIPPMSSDSPTLIDKNKKLFIVYLTLWLAAWPTAILVTVSMGLLLKNSSLETVKSLINIISLLLGMYGLMGWIPVLIFGIKMSKIRS